MLGLRRYAVNYGTRCLAKFGKGSLSSSKSDAILTKLLTNLTANSMTFSQKEQMVCLTSLNFCDVSSLLKHFGLYQDSKSSFNGKNLTAVDSKAELAEMIGYDMSNAKFKSFMTCFDAFKIIGVPVCLINDGTIVDNTRITSIVPSISHQDSGVSTSQSNHTRDYSKVQVLKGQEKLYSTSLLPENKVITLSTDMTLRIWNLEANECEQVWNSEFYRSVLTTLSDGRFVIADGEYRDDDRLIRIYDPLTKLCVQTLEGHTDNVTSLHVLEDNTIVSESLDNSVRLWNPDSGECLRKLVCEAWSDVMFAVSKNMIVLLSSDNNTIHIWNGLTGDCKEVLKCHPDIVRSLCRLPDGRLVSGASDNLIRIWNVESSMCESTLRSHSAAVTKLAVLPDGRLVSGSHDNTIRIWNVNTSECEQVIETSHDIRKLLVLKDGRIVCSDDNNGSLHIYG